MIEELEKRAQEAIEHLTKINEQIKKFEDAAKKLGIEIRYTTPDGDILWFKKRLFIINEEIERPLIEAPAIERIRMHKYLNLFIEKLIEKSKKHY